MFPRGSQKSSALSWAALLRPCQDFEPPWQCNGIATILIWSGGVSRTQSVGKKRRKKPNPITYSYVFCFHWVAFRSSGPFMGRRELSFTFTNITRSFIYQVDSQDRDETQRMGKKAEMIMRW